MLVCVIEVNPEQRRMRLSISALEEQEHQARHGEESHKREEPREGRRQQQSTHDEEPHFNPFADAFRSQDFSR